MKYRRRVPKLLSAFIDKKEIVKIVHSEKEKIELNSKIENALMLAQSDLSEKAKRALILDALGELVSKKKLKDELRYMDAAKMYIEQSRVSQREYKNRRYFFEDLLPALIKYVYEENPYLSEITPAHLNKIAGIIQKLPSRNYAYLKKIDSYQLIYNAVNGEYEDMKKLHVDTVNKHIKRIRSLAHYGFRTGLFNMTTAIPTVKHHYSAREQRQALTLEEIEVIYNACKNPEVQNFIMLIRYTGMRVGEVGKYKLKVINGIECFDLREAESLKTKSSFRIIPKHPRLEVYEFTYTLEHLSRQVKILIDKYLDDTEKKTGYSLRHTFASELIKQDVSPDIVSELLGHKHIGMTLSRYAKGFSVEQLFEAICKL